ncbi:PepSY domain-containing protein [Rugamonas sp.]|uniref:PepSY-associated TM helix domain-containing protein n=1 Tax=Rugamonas sp. TaxID=1926287 RepID=UPI0025E0260F|nr:PepSY-associated TM helix domain-containing protein [Rugamonas sp.]
MKSAMQPSGLQKSGLRQSMAWLHTWSGLLVCWVLWLIFCAGTASYYRQEITLWMTPEWHQLAMRPADPVAAAERAIDVMQRRSPHALRWAINLPQARTPALRVYWSEPAQAGSSKRGRFQNVMLDPDSGATLPPPRATRGGEFFYRLHFDLYYMAPETGRWIVGFCTMFMLVAILSGVVTHKRIFKDFFTFRPGKGPRSWLDAHNAVAVLALPYHLMITYTGLVATLFLYMPAGVQVAYHGRQAQMDAEMYPSEPKVKPAGVAAPLTAIAPLMLQAQQRWHGVPAGKVSIDNPNDRHAVVIIEQRGGAHMSRTQPALVFDGVSGALLSSSGDDAPAAATRNTMVGLHIANFAQPALRALFFLSGLAGCAMVATGALLWTLRERNKQRQFGATLAGRCGLRLAEGLNLGAIAGLPIAIGAYFWANRLLPLDAPLRADLEIHCFFATWAAAAVLAQLSPGRAMWRAQLALAALALGGVPLLNGLTTDSHLGVTLLQGRGPLPVAAFDLTLLGLGLLFAYAAWRLRGPGRAAAVAATPADAADRHPDPLRELA